MELSCDEDASLDDDDDSDKSLGQFSASHRWTCKSHVDARQFGHFCNVKLALIQSFSLSPLRVTFCLSSLARPLTRMTERRGGGRLGGRGLGEIWGLMGQLSNYILSVRSCT